MFSLIRQAKLKHVYVLILITGFFSMGQFSSAHAQPASPPKNKQVIVDAIIAVVNNDVITRGELNERLTQVEQKLKEQGVALPPRSEMQRQLLEHMIVESAQLQLAKEMGIRVDDTQLDRTIALMAEKNRMTIKEFEAQVQKDGMSYIGFRENIRSEITMHRLREREVINKIQVSEAEVDNILGASTGQQAVMPEVRLGHILIRIPENASPEQIANRRARAEQVLQALRSGGNFQQNAATYSDADDGLSGGDMGWRNYDRLPQLFIQGIEHLKPGEVSEILKSTNGFHIVKVFDRRQTAVGPVKQTAGNTPTPVQQIHARHILIKVNNLVSAEEAKRKLSELKQRLDNNADTFENLARLYSNDLSASKGGDLGWIYPGDTVPEFERAMVALKPGQISNPVETQFGFHLIQVLEQKTDDMSLERKRIAIRNALRDRKIEEATEEWVRQIRDRAYVEYRIDDK